MSSKRREPKYLDLGELIVAYATPPEPLLAVQPDGESCRMRPTAVSLTSPVELEIRVDSSGRVELASAPPLYDVDTSFRPVFQRLTLEVDVTLSSEEAR